MASSRQMGRSIHLSRNPIRVYAPSILLVGKVRRSERPPVPQRLSDDKEETESVVSVDSSKQKGKRPASGKVVPRKILGTENEPMESYSRPNAKGAVCLKPGCKKSVRWTRFNNSEKKNKRRCQKSYQQNDGKAGKGAAN